MIRSSRARALALSGACALAYASPAFAIQFKLESHVGDVWTYTLTYDPHDNYNEPPVLQTMISVYNLSGVTDTGAPTSTDFDPSGGLDGWNLEWTPAIFDNGTEVHWTNADVDAGTGNFDVPKHVYGFTIVSSDPPGIVHFDTSGFVTDAGGADVDVIGGNAIGPNAAPEPGAAASLGGVAVLALLASRRRRARD